MSIISTIYCLHLHLHHQLSSFIIIYHHLSSFILHHHLSTFIFISFIIIYHQLSFIIILSSSSFIFTGFRLTVRPCSRPRLRVLTAYPAVALACGTHLCLPHCPAPLCWVLLALCACVFQISLLWDTCSPSCR